MTALELFMPPLVGLLLALGMGWLVKPLLARTKRSMSLPPPTTELAAQWAKVVSGNEGGATLGHLERLLFFVAFWQGTEALVAAWLAFKVASKWNAWTNIVAVPKDVPGLDPLDQLIARRNWGSHVLMTFLVGTLANLLIGFFGAAVAKHGLAVARALGC